MYGSNPSCGCNYVCWLESTSLVNLMLNARCRSSGVWRLLAFNDVLACMNEVRFTQLIPYNRFMQNWLFLQVSTQQPPAFNSALSISMPTSPPINSDQQHRPSGVELSVLPFLKMPQSRTDSLPPLMRYVWHRTHAPEDHIRDQAAGGELVRLVVPLVVLHVLMRPYVNPVMSTTSWKARR